MRPSYKKLLKYDTLEKRFPLYERLLTHGYE